MHPNPKGASASDKALALALKADADALVLERHGQPDRAQRLRHRARTLRALAAHAERNARRVA